MSDIFSYGVIAALKTPVADPEEFSELLYDKCESILKVNYDGTLVYVDMNGSWMGDPYHLIFTSDKKLLDMTNELFVRAKKHGLEVDGFKVKQYSCFWNNRADSPIDMISLEEFLDETP